MNEDYAPTHDSDESWAIAEQWFMRFFGASLLIIAVISMIFGVFPPAGNEQLVRGVNITLTVFLGIGSMWTLWWSSDIERMYNLIDGFKENGSMRTYIAAIMQFIIGALFALELLNGRYALGLMGTVIVLSGVFFLWRAQQIRRFT